MSEGIIPRLEAIEVDEQDRRAQSLALRAGERLAQSVDDQCAVRQSGERVVERAVFERGFGAAAIGDVADVRHDALHGGFVQEVRGPQLEPSPSTVRVPAAEFDRMFLSGIADDRIEVRDAQRVIFGMDESEQIPTDEIVGAVAEDMFQSRADVRRTGARIDDDDDVGRVPNQRAKSLRRPA